MKPTRTTTCTAAPLLLAAAIVSSPAWLGAQAPSATPPAATVPAPSVPAATAVPALRSSTRNNLFLDPAHGGSDDGARIGDRLLEKDLTLALATRIRTQLADQPNLNLIVTREADATGSALDPQSPAQSSDSRAGMANHAHPFACVLLHATGAGSGVHIVTSELPPPAPNTPSSPGIPWSTAQSNYVRQSLRLANQVGISLRQAGVPVYLTRASVRPLDSLTCPAIAIELAPPHPTTNPSTIADPSYQQRVATAIAAALIFWRTHNEPAAAVAAPAAAARPASEPAIPSATPRSLPAQTQSTAPQPKAASPATAPRSATRPAPAPAGPAPIIRRPPAQTPAPIVRPPVAPATAPDSPQNPPPPGARP